jgi:2-oxoglutarate dehydrogenase E2 component (dihydrolipoamide succinyltransferase)
MSYPLKMPQLGETVVEGTILKWLKKEGESVAIDEPLFEISTDKVDTEVPSPVSGTLRRIIVGEGETVDVGTAIAELDTDGSSAPAPPEPNTKAEATPEAASAAAPPREPATEQVADGSAEEEARAAVGLFTPPSDGAGARSAILSPIVRKLASENGVDLSEVTGTGEGGRITKKDVEGFIASRGEVPAAASAPPAPSAATSTRAATAGARDELIPVTHIRRAIAEHMHRSLQVSARAWNMVEVDLERITRLMSASKEGFLAREGFKLTYTPFVARAACDALMEFPMANAELRDDGIMLHRYVNLGIAVSYEDGLIVPVVKGAESMNTTGLARTINDLATRARAKRLQPDEVHGGTFSITNPGPFGSILSVPIINQPQSAILAFDAVQKRPVVVDDAIAIRNMVYISMSWDHRVIDGALASQFLARVKENLETFDFESDLGL